MRKYFSVVLALMFVGGIGLSLTYRAQAQVQTPTLSATQTPTLSATVTVQPISRAALVDYGKLVQSSASDAALLTWARTYKVDIVRLKNGQVVFVPDQLPGVSTTEEAGACNHTLCPTATGATVVTGLGNSLLGVQQLICRAGSCRWVYNTLLKRNVRVCENWRCSNSGTVIPL